MGWIASLAMLMGGAGPVLAQQEMPSIRPGQEVRGSLGGQDSVLESHGPFTAYRFDAREGMIYRITLRSGDFDAYLLVARPVGGITETVAMDDDGGGGSDAQVVFYPSASGEYVAIVTSFPDDPGIGAFVLTLDEIREEPIAGVAIDFGRQVEGILDPSTARLDPRGDYYSDDFLIRASEGQILWIDAMSDDFDAYLSFGRLERGRYSELDADDDGGENLNARLTLVVPEDGEYIVRVTSSEPGERGRYTLNVEEVLARRDAPETRAIEAGRPVSAILTREDAILASGEFYQHWAYAGSAGETIVITLRSDDFDAYLSFGRMEGGVFDEIDSDDDGGGGTDSQLTITLPRAGEYVIRATSFFRWATGEYTLHVTTSRSGDQVD